MLLDHFLTLFFFSHLMKKKELDIDISIGK